MAQRVQGHLKVDASEIRLQKPGQALPGSRQAERSGRQKAQKKQQHGHQILAGPFQAAFQSRPDDEAHQQHGREHIRPQGRDAGRRGVEHGGETCRVRAVSKGAAKAFQPVDQQKGQNDAVIGQDADACRHAQPTRQPERAARRRQPPHPQDAAVPRAAAKRYLRDEQGHAHYQGGQQIDQKKGSAAVLAHHVGETPDGPQAHGKSRCGHDEAQAASPGGAMVHVQFLQVTARHGEASCPARIFRL